MSIVVIGINHRTAPLELLERLAMRGELVSKTALTLCAGDNISEAVVLSTCNRTEVYAVAERFHAGFDDICDVLAATAELNADDIEPHLYSHHDAAAVSHLFGVTCGLDSAVLGEHEILGQARTAWEAAMGDGTSRAELNLLFRHAIETGKRARTETAISRSTASVSHAAVEMAIDELGGLADRRILVVGAGSMGEQMTVALGAHGVHEIAVTNRTAARARELASRVGGRVAPFVDLPAALAEADLVLTSTGAGEAVIAAATVALAMNARPDRPLLIVDIALPRDVEAAVGAIPGVTLRNLDDLRAFAARGVERRAAEVAGVQAIVAEEADRYEAEARARQAVPLIAQLHGMAESVRVGELERHARRLAGLDDDQRAAVEAVTRAIVAKLLHTASVQLRADAGTPRGARNAAALRDLFELPG